MKITINNTIYTIGWMYESTELNLLADNSDTITREELKRMTTKEILTALNIKSLPLPDITHCNVKMQYPGESEPEFVDIIVKKSHLDPWNKEKARIYSLQKFVRGEFPGRINRSNRKIFWDTYHGRKKVNPECKIKRLIKSGLFNYVDLREFVMKNFPATFEYEKSIL